MKSSFPLSNRNKGRESGFGSFVSSPCVNQKGKKKGKLDKAYLCNYSWNTASANSEYWMN